METAEHKKHRIYSMSITSLYPLYITKVEKKDRTKEELDKVICWLTGYSQNELEKHIEMQTDLETFYSQAKMNPERRLIKGIICGVRVEDIEDPTMQSIRYLDKLVDELAQRRPMEKILRKQM